MPECKNSNATKISGKCQNRKIKCDILGGFQTVWTRVSKWNVNTYFFLFVLYIFPFYFTAKEGFKWRLKNESNFILVINIFSFGMEIRVAKEQPNPWEIVMNVTSFENASSSKRHKSSWKKQKGYNYI